MLPWLRDFTDLPLGVYPNLGYYTESGWAFDQRIGGEEYARAGGGWRDDGADIIGGCCGVRPHHIGAAKTRLAGTRPGRRHASADDGWTDERRRRAAERVSSSRGSTSVAGASIRCQCPS